MGTTPEAQHGDGGTAVVPVHPEPVPGEERVIRWVMPPGTLGFVGAVDVLPPGLQPLLDDGTIEEIFVEPAAIRVRLGQDRVWRTEGARVRSALQAALTDRSRWTGRGGSSPDAVLAMAVTQVLDGHVGAFVRSHGGSITVIGVHAGEVEVELSGSCSHCPSAELTLAGRFENAVRELYPELRRIRAHEAASPGSRRGLGLLSLRTR